MNIILLIIDTMRYDYIGTNGNDWIETPNLDRLASQSWCFDRAFAASFPTIPYRTDVMTGKYGSPFHAWKPLPFNTNALPSVPGRSRLRDTTPARHPPPRQRGPRLRLSLSHLEPSFAAPKLTAPWINDEAKWPSNWAKDPLFDLLEDELPTPLIQYARTNRGRDNLDDWNCAKLFNTAAEFLRDNKNRENFFLWIDCFDPNEPWGRCPPNLCSNTTKRPTMTGRLDPRTFKGGAQARSNPNFSDEAKARIKASYAAKSHLDGPLLWPIPRSL